MVGSKLQAEIESLNEIDGIRARPVRSDSVSHDSIVIVDEENAVGQFMKQRRLSELNYSSVNRNSFDKLSAWIDE